MTAALTVRNLTVKFHGAPAVTAVNGVSFEMAPGELVGLVGESGCGKTATANAVMGLTGHGQITADSIRLGARELTTLDERAVRKLRGREISMVFQEPQTALDPVMSVGRQLRSVIRRLGIADRHDAPAVAEKALGALGLADTRALMKRYPHQLSGGMRQRVLIAMAMIGQPRVLIADEPTTALDVTTQAQVLQELIRLGREHRCAILLITHDLALATRVCERIMVMRDGTILETATTGDMLAGPKHEYTAALLAAVPRLEGDVPDHGAPDGPLDPSPALPLMALRNHRVSYPVRFQGRRRRLVAVRDASLDIRRGEILGLVGESGCGKSSLAQSLVGLKPAEAGEFQFDGARVRRGDWARIRRRVQLVFQDPRASLSPRRTVGQSLYEPLDHFGLGTEADRPGRIAQALQRVGLDSTFASRFPGELSGGQRQRVALARALIAEPDLVVADEPLSSLDVTVQARIIRLLKALRQEMGFALLLVSHDLAVIRQLADRVAVMYLGRIVEYGPSGLIFANPAHPYTRALLRAAVLATRHDQAIHRDRQAPVAEAPSPLTPPPGCVFHTRCPEAMSRCLRIDPPEVGVDHGKGTTVEHRVRCLLHD